MGNPWGYLVLCLNFQKGALGKFELTIQSDKPISEIKDNLDLVKKEYSCQLKQSWNKANAGGCVNEKTFLRNPKYEISVSGDCEAFIELSSPFSYPLGIYLIEYTG